MHYRKRLSKSQVKGKILRELNYTEYIFIMQDETA